MNLAKILFQTQLNVKDGSKEKVRSNSLDFDQLLTSTLSNATKGILASEKQGKQSLLNNSHKSPKTKKEAKEPSTLSQSSSVKTDVFMLTLATSPSPVNTESPVSSWNNFYSTDATFLQFRGESSAQKYYGLKQNLKDTASFSKERFLWDFPVNNQQAIPRKVSEKKQSQHGHTFITLRKIEKQSVLIRMSEKVEKLSVLLQQGTSPFTHSKQLSSPSNLLTSRVLQPEAAPKKTIHSPKNGHSESLPVKNEKKTELFSAAVNPKDTKKDITQKTVIYELSPHTENYVFSDSPRRINLHLSKNSDQIHEKHIFYQPTDFTKKKSPEYHSDKKIKPTEWENQISQQTYRRINLSSEKSDKKITVIPAAMQYADKTNRHNLRTVTGLPKDFQQTSNNHNIITEKPLHFIEKNVSQKESRPVQDTKTSKALLVSNQTKPKKTTHLEHHQNHLHNKNVEKENPKEKSVDNTEPKLDESFLYFNLAREKKEEIKYIETGYKNVSTDNRLSSELFVREENSFSHSQDSFNGETQHYKADHIEEGKLEENNNRQMTFSLKIGDISFKARYNGYKLDLMILMNNYSADFVKAMKTDIPHILEETGIQSYILRIKNKEKNYKVSSSYSHTDYKNSSLREIDVKV